MFVAPPLPEGGRWEGLGKSLEVGDDVVAAAKQRYYEPHGPSREAWRARPAYLTLDVETLVVYSRDDERHSFTDAEEVVPRMPRARLVLVDGLSHRRTARDPGVIRTVADFLC